MKKTILISILLSVLLLTSVLLAGCTGGQAGGDSATTAPDSGVVSTAGNYDKELKRAADLIAANDLTAAYELLSGLKDCERAQEMLGNFRYVITSGEAYADPFTVEYDEDFGKAVLTFGYGNLLLEINENGAVITSEFLYKDGSKYVAIFDEIGNLLSSEYTHSDGKTSKTEQKINEHGDVVYYKYVSVSGETEEKTYEYSYSEDGKLLGGTEYGPTPKETRTYFYDGDLLVKVTKITSDGVWTEEKYTYDADGRIVTEDYTSRDSARSFVYSYNANGQLIRSKYYTASYQSTRELTYDEHGNMIQEVFVYNSDSYTVKFAYELVYCEKNLSALTDYMIYIIED